MRSRFAIFALLCLVAWSCSPAASDASNDGGGNLVRAPADPIDPAAPAASNGAATPVASSAGVMASVPITLGYYVNEDSSCADPLSVIWFGPDSFKFIDADGASETRLASVEKQPDGNYVLNFDEAAADDEMGAIMVQPRTPGHIQVSIQDDAPMKLCAADALPARYRK